MASTKIRIFPYFNNSSDRVPSRSWCIRIINRFFFGRDKNNILPNGLRFNNSNDHTLSKVSVLDHFKLFLSHSKSSKKKTTTTRS